MLNDTHIPDSAKVDAQTAHTLLQFPKERKSGGMVFPSPVEGQTIHETPPAFVWLPPEEDTAHTVLYRITVWDAADNPVFCKEVYGNTCVPDQLLSAGAYTWDVEAPALGMVRGKEHFIIADDAIPFLRPTVDEVLAGIPCAHPRHLFTKNDIPEIVRTHTRELETLRRNIRRAYDDGLPEHPRFHTGDADALPYREYFGRFRDFCDRNLVACALGYHLLDGAEAEKAGQFAKKLFLCICDWNPLGPCALTGSWGDEIGLSCARCFPAVFDLVYPLLDDKQRSYCANTVAAYAEQCEARLSRLDYLKTPGDSHAGRLPAYLGEAALVLWGEAGQNPDTLRRWLSYALTVYGGPFPFFGTPDGGWAEGTFYSTSYTKWFLPFFSAVARFSGKSLFDRPFYRNFAHFLLHFALPDHEIHPFGDGYWCNPDSPEWPGFFAQNPFHIYAALSGLDEAKVYDRQLSAPKLYQLHLLDVFLPTEAIQTAPQAFHAACVTDADAFPDAGFISLHSCHTNPKTDLHLIARASKFGPGSHRQPDNGSFALFYGGNAFIAPSGYFGRAYGTKHHMQWLNTTKAHNAILIDGVGQSYRDFRHTAKIVSCGIDAKTQKRYAVLDMTASYPMLRTWQRTFSFTDDHTVVIEDTVLSDTAVTVTYPLHMLSEPSAFGQTITLTHGGYTMKIVPDAGCFASLLLSDRYDVDLNEGEPEAFHVTMPKQFHAYYETEQKKEHHLKVTFRICP
ncbi:MAG: heparinase II/III family protein [Clostridia bacterium]|nr:heparinase II/III family protein [Clostridia bacterium]